MRAVIAVAACALILPGCGGGAEGGAQRSGRLVDFSQKPSYVNALDIDPATGDFLMTTNRGFFRIDARTHAVGRVRAMVTTSSQSAGVGTFLDILSTGPGKLLGSGHRDVKGRLPPYPGGQGIRLGWPAVDALYRGEKDGTIVATQDGGRHWKETFHP